MKKQRKSNKMSKDLTKDNNHSVSKDNNKFTRILDLWAEIEENKCELCGKIVLGYKFCEECIEYIKIWR